MNNLEKWALSIQPTVKSHFIDEQFSKHWSKQSAQWDHFPVVLFISIAFDPVMASFYVFGHRLDLERSSGYCSQSNSRMDSC